MADTNGTPIRDTAQLTEELVERARAIAPAIAARAEAAEQNRRVADETIADVANAGLFEIMVPQRFGGHELGISSMAKVIKALSPLDVSTGWTLAFYMVHNWMWCLLPEEAQKEIFADGPSRLGPVMVAPTVKASPVEGGYRINGRAKWGTGSSHAQWCMVSGIVAEDLPAPSEGQPPRPPAVRMFAMPWSEAKLEDTWRTSGMAATASHDVVFDDIFIPAHRVMDATPARSGEAEGAQIHDSSVYTAAFTPMLCVAALSAIVGGTLGAAEHAVERAKTFLSTFSGQTSVDNPALQIRLAKADLAAQTASQMIDILAQEIEADAMAPPIPLENRARQRAMSSYIASMCRDAVTLLAQGSGASGHMSDSPIQRAFRDINMASCHVVFDQDPTMELHGKMLVGRPPAIILA
ncbi:acyl-CoA dehydrogenase family protein [Hyphomonas sp.]|uniref:acyl-CoA dehydrogenase family protein n=1 Tax=Hyphomonas sp. TaxID=87 RepID=UPI001D65023F|nr:acyl-CoA dehydrogenase family protein [Hyphomonas sp.]